MAKLYVLKKRKEFLRVAKVGLKMVTSTIILTAAQNLCITGECPKDFTTERHPRINPLETKSYFLPITNYQLPITRIGFTTTKKLGKANIRNLARRRMRALVRTHLDKFLPQTDYVLIGRFNTADIDFTQLEKDFLWGLNKLNKLLTEKQNEK